MAEQQYRRGEGITPIQNMNTRQLRMYIRERAEEAQERVSSIKKLDDTSRAFQDQLSHVYSYGPGRGGAIKKDTSHMSKEEMAEYAYALRDLNMLDTDSKVSRDLDYKENKERYEKFIKERTREDNPNDLEKARWKRYLTDKGNVSKRGYQEYKNFVNFLRNIDEAMSTYGYESIKDYYYDETDREEQAFISDLLVEVYEENKAEKTGVALTPSELLDKFQDKLDEHKQERKAQILRQRDIDKAKKARKAKSAPLPKAKNVKAKNTKSNSKSVKVKQVGKMKSGSIRNKQTPKRS